MANKKHPSRTKMGHHEPFEFQVARGQIGGHAGNLKFGYNPNVSSATWSTIWTQRGQKAWRTEAPGTTYVITSATADKTGETGATSLFISGMDANYTSISEVVALTTGPGVSIPCSNTYLRVDRAFVLTASTSGTNSGHIYVGSSAVTGNVPGTVDAEIDPDAGQTQQCTFTVPVNKTYYGIDFKIFVGRSGNANVDARARIRTFGGAWRTVNYFPLYQSPEEVERHIYFKIPEKSDVEFQAMTDTGEQLVAANVEYIAVDTTLENG